ncbi:hypothetical protein MTO96_014643 [Rhipicephalus appendiculatus]
MSEPEATSIHGRTSRPCRYELSGFVLLGRLWRDVRRCAWISAADFVQPFLPRSRACLNRPSRAVRCAARSRAAGPRLRCLPAVNAGKTSGTPDKVGLRLATWHYYRHDRRRDEARQWRGAARLRLASLEPSVVRETGHPAAARHASLSSSVAACAQRSRIRFVFPHPAPPPLHSTALPRKGGSEEPGSGERK